MTPVALSIAGIDPSGGAGVFADMKTFSALGAYGTGVVVALTAQNTRTVSAVEIPSPGFVRQQLRTLFSDLRVDAIKTGMLANKEIVEVVAQELADYLRLRPSVQLVVDPVMISKSGKSLLDAAAVDAFKQKILPLAHVLTPNLPEAGCLLGENEPESEKAMRVVGERLLSLIAPNGAVLMKGGHLDKSRSKQATDFLHIKGRDPLEFSTPRISTNNTHGTGCTYSAAICALLARGLNLVEAVSRAKAYLHAAIEQADSLSICAQSLENESPSHGPVQHFHPWWPSV